MLSFLVLLQSSVFLPFPMPVTPVRAECFAESLVFTFHRNRKNEVKFKAEGFTSQLTLEEAGGTYMSMAEDGTVFTYHAEENEGTTLIKGKPVQLRCVQIGEY